MDPSVKKMAQAVKGDETKLITQWSDSMLTECKLVDTLDTTNPHNPPPERGFECTSDMSGMPATEFFERIGQLGRQGYDVKLLYDSEVVGTGTEIGELGSLREGRL